MTISKDDPIAIIGAGAFGLSTALELSNQGYSNITVFEKDEEIPSRWSAANDLNKIMRAEYEDDFYTNLAVVCLSPTSTTVGFSVNGEKGSYKRLANASICTILSPRWFSELCVR